MNLKPLIFATLAVLATWASYAQKAPPEKFKHHVIFLIDHNLRFDGGVSNLKTALDEIKKICFEGDSLTSRPLLGPGDYLSVLGFGLSYNERDIGEFISTNLFGNEFGFKYRQNTSADIVDSLYTSIRSRGYVGRAHYSIVNAAIPLAINQLQRNDLTIHRTFVFLLGSESTKAVTSPYAELGFIDYLINNKKDAPIKHLNSTINQIFHLEQFFVAKLLRPIEIGRTLRVELFEYTPIQASFSIESLAVFNHKDILFKRYPGYYQANFPIAILKQHPNFQVKKMQLWLQGNKSKRRIAGSDTTFYNPRGQLRPRFRVTPEQLAQEGGFTIQMKGWVAYRDGIYNTHMLHPEGQEIQGSKGLSRPISTKVEPQATFGIFGQYKLRDAWFGRATWWNGGDQHRFVNRLNWLLGIAYVLAALLLIIWFIKWYSRDRSSSDVTME